MAAALMSTPETRAFRDISRVNLWALKFEGEQALRANEDVDRMLQAAEEPLPVLKVSVNNLIKSDLPHIWMGVGMTEPNKGLQYVEDTEYHPRPNAPSKQVKIPGLAVPVAYDSVSSVNFWPYALKGHETEAPDGWWEQWQRHSFTQQAGDYKLVHEYEDELTFGRKLFVTWFRRSALEEKSGLDVRVTTPVIVTDEPDASEVDLIPCNIVGRYVDLRNKAAIFIGDHSVQAMLDNTSRMAVPKDQAPEPFHAMMHTVAHKLGLSYSS